MTLGRIVLLALSTIALGVVIVDFTSEAKEEGVSVSPRTAATAAQAGQSTTGVVSWGNWRPAEPEAPVVDEEPEFPEEADPGDRTDKLEKAFNERFKGMEFARKPGRAREGGE